MHKRVVLWKKQGETPLQAIARWKTAHPAYTPIPASYAGRLDPMAEGKLLVLLGDECKKQTRYHGLDKEYEIEVLLGVGSDTGDALGLVRSVPDPDLTHLSNILRAEQGTHERAYPAYSSKTVRGKPLFLYALEGMLQTITIPTHAETIYRITAVGVETLVTKTLRERIAQYLRVVPTTEEPSKELGADFRLNAVRASWDTVLQQERTYRLLRLTVTCGSGAYMRTLAERIGTALGSNGIALSITRTKLGKYWKGFWYVQYS